MRGREIYAERTDMIYSGGERMSDERKKLWKDMVAALEQNHEILNEAMNLMGREHEGFVGEEMMNRWHDNETLLARIYGSA